MDNTCDSFTKSVNLISNLYYSELISRVEKIEDEVLGNKFYFFYLCKNHKISSEKNKTKITYQKQNKERETYIDDIYSTFKRYFGSNLGFLIISKTGTTDETYIIT